MRRYCKNQARTSDPVATLAYAMDEANFQEIEKALLYISDARQRVRKAADAVTKAGGEKHLVDALADADSDLGALHKRLMQRTYFAVVEQTQLSA